MEKLTDNLITKWRQSEYNDNRAYNNSNWVNVDKENKRKLILDCTKICKSELKKHLTKVYVCESCGESQYEKWDIAKCTQCGTEICTYCQNGFADYLKLCHKCSE
jgi:hypothetical protein